MRKKLSKAALLRENAKLLNSSIKLDNTVEDYRDFAAELFKLAIECQQEKRTISNKYIVERLSGIFNRRGMPYIKWR